MIALNSPSAAGQCIDYGNYLHLAGSVDTPGGAYGVAVAGDYAYVADLDGGLQVIDISNPESPVIAGSVGTPGQAYSVAVAGDFAYVADGVSGLQVIDITNPEGPVIAGSVDTPGFAYSVAVAGEQAYLADDASGLHVVDISNPESPVIAGSVVTPGSAYGVAVAGDFACVADGPFGGLQVIDITNPESPVMVGSVDTPQSARRVAVVGDYAYLADLTAGLQIAPAQCFDTVPTLLSGFDASVVDGGVRVAWTLSEAGIDMTFNVSRTTGDNATFSTISVDIERSELHFSFVDDAVEPGTCVLYRVSVEDKDGHRTLFSTQPITIPGLKFTLGPNTPNPFNPGTTIRFTVPGATRVRLVIYDVQGRLVRTLLDRTARAGVHSAWWNGQDDSGSAVASGVYFVRLTSGNQSRTRKLTLLK